MLHRGCRFRSGVNTSLKPTGCESEAPVLSAFSFGAADAPAAVLVVSFGWSEGAGAALTAYELDAITEWTRL